MNCGKEILYTGASYENDIKPAVEVGMRALYLEKNLKPGASSHLPPGVRQVAAGVLFGKHSLYTQFEMSLQRIEEQDAEVRADKELRERVGVPPRRKTPLDLQCQRHLIQESSPKPSLQTCIIRPRPFYRVNEKKKA